MARNLVLLKEAESLASELSAGRVPAVFLKGIALLEAAYQDVSVRELTDIDLLVQAYDLAKTERILRDRGYTARPNSLVASKWIGPILVQIDLHSDLWFFAGDDYWRRSRKKAPLSCMHVLAAEDAFLHCILHSVIQDGKISPQALADCSAILKYHGTDFSWDTFAGLVSREGWQLPVEVFLDRLKADRTIHVPRDLLGEMRDRKSISAWLQDDISPFIRILHFQSRPCRRLDLLLRLIFPGRSFLRMRYSWFPRRLAFLLYFLRPVFLMAETLQWGTRALIMRGKSTSIAKAKCI